MNIAPTAIVSKNIRVRYEDRFTIGDYSVIDDFCYFSTLVNVNKFAHIAANCTVAGGRDSTFYLGNFSCLASGVRLYCSSDDFTNDLATVLPEWCTDVKNHLVAGDVCLNDYVTIGANTVVMPGNNVPEGTVIGAMSFVPRNYEFKPWSVYAGCPRLRLIGQRNKSNVLDQAREVLRRKEI